MRKHQTISRTVNSIFNELRQVACITVRYKHATCGAETLRIYSINGHSNGLTFTTWLEDACDRATRQFMSELSKLSSQEQVVLTKYAINRCRRLGVMPSSEDLEEFNPKFILLVTKEQEKLKCSGKLARGFTYRFFIIRHLFMGELANRLRCIALNHCFCPERQVHVMSQAETTRLSTTFSVQMLAGFARILYETGFFKDTSKLAVCKRFASLFSTPRQKEVSFNNFRNHFNGPDQASVTKIVEILGKLMKNAENLMDPERFT